MLGNIIEAAPKASSSGGFNPSTLIFLAIIIAAVYMLMIRPQQRRKQQAAQQQNTVQPGARVRTTAGMYATVVDVDGDDVILEVAPGIEIRYMKRAIMDVVSPPETTDDSYTDVEAEDESGDVEEPDDNAADDTEDSAYEQATGTKKDR